MGTETEAPARFDGPTLRHMIVDVREVNTALGWRQGTNTVDDYIALLHTELGKATDAYRRWRFADATGIKMEPIYGEEDHMGNRHVIDWRPPKPEGVGSEFADVLIRLLDHGDVLGLNGWTELVHSRVPEPPTRGHALTWLRPAMTTFGRQIAWLHHLVDVAYLVLLSSGLRPGGYDQASVLAWQEIFDELRRACAAYGIDLMAEYVRKLAYNRTREFQHGGRTLNEATPRRTHVWTAGCRIAACAACTEGSVPVEEGGGDPYRCRCEQLDWSDVTDEDRGEDGMNHHPQCLQDKVRPHLNRMAS